MEIKYKNTLDDYINCNWFLNKTGINVSFYGYQVILFIMIIISITEDDTVAGKIFMSAIFIIMWIAWVAFFNKGQEKRLIKKIKKQIDRDPSLLSEKVLTINKNNITIKSNKEVKEFEFKTISKILEENNCIYLLNNQAKQKYIAIIPTKFFPNSEKKEQFLELINHAVKNN